MPHFGRAKEIAGTMGLNSKGEIPSRALGPAARDPSLLDQVAKRDNVRGRPNCDGNQSDPTDDLVFHDTLCLYRFPPELAAVPSRRRPGNSLTRGGAKRFN
jgi:hypothetical protein